MVKKRGRRADTASTASSNDSSVATMPILTPQATQAQLPINNSRMNFPTIQIQPFDGDPEELNFFISQLTNMAKMYNWSEESFMMFISQNLRGIAKKFFFQKSEITKFESAEQIFDELRTFFLQKSVAAHSKELDSLHMFTDEKIANLSHRLEVLVHKVYNKITDRQALDQIKFNKFLQVIPHSYRLLIRQNEIDNFTSAVAKATLAQDCEIENSIIRKSEGTSNEKKFSEINEQIHSIQESLDNLNKPDNRHKRSNFSNKRSPRRNFNNRGNFNANRVKFHRGGNRRNFRRPRGFNYNRGTRNSNFNDRNTYVANSQWQSDQNTQVANIQCQLCLCLGHSARQCRIAPALNYQQNSIPVIDHPNA